MANLYSISNRANVNAYSYQDKYIFVYDDHRTLLNVLFEAKKAGLFYNSNTRENTCMARGGFQK